MNGCGGRKDILNWLNGFLQLELSKVEDTANGAIYCQLIDALHPGAVPMHKVNWEARLEPEIFMNYKLLQQAFNKLNIDKSIDMERLGKGLPMDSLEFLQWFKRYFDMIGPVSDYEPISQRERGKGGIIFNQSQGIGRSFLTEGGPSPTGDAGNLSPYSKGGGSDGSFGTQKSNRQEKTSTNVKEMTALIKDLREEICDIESERDFYFDKLRDCELLLQTDREGSEDELSKAELKKNLLKILYATMEDYLQPAESTRNEDKVTHKNTRISRGSYGSSSAGLPKIT